MEVPTIVEKGVCDCSSIAVIRWVNNLQFEVI